MKKKCYLYNFPGLKDNLRVREPSILYAVPDHKEWNTEFVFDGSVKKDGDLYLCSVFTCGYPDFKQFAAKLEKKKIIAGGYHPSLCPGSFTAHAQKVVVGYGNNIDEIIRSRKKGILHGTFKANHMDRSVFPLEKLKEAWYADVFPDQKTFSINSFTGCPEPCDYAGNCYIYSTYKNKKTYYPLSYIKEELKLLSAWPYDNLCIRDEGFFRHPEFRKITELLARTGKRIYSFVGPLEGVTDDLMKFLKDHGWFCLAFGSFQREGSENKELLRAGELAHKHGINIHFNIIIEPSKKEKGWDYLKSLGQLMLQYMPASMEVYFWTSYPGTPGYKARGMLGNVDYSMMTDDIYKSESGNLRAWHERRLFALQYKYYNSAGYARMRNFNCGDILNLRMKELAGLLDLK